MIQGYVNELKERFVTIEATIFCTGQAKSN